MPENKRDEKLVTIYNPDKCYNGYSLFCHTYDDPGTDKERLARMYLIDMHGNPVHEWTVNTAVQLLELLPDGSLYYSTRDRSNITRAGLYRIAPDSSVLWRYHCRVDHDYHVMPDGRLTIHCLIDKMVPELGHSLRRNPYIVEIDAEKKLLWEWHGEEHVRELLDFCGDDVAARWREGGPFEFDWAHNNNCEVIPENASGAKDPRFRAGNILFSYRSLDIIGIIDRQSGEIVWAWGPGELDGQHKPTMLPNGHVLVFDNGTLRRWSRVIELDPLSGDIVWEYTGAPKESFSSGFISGAEMLPNGNVFICEGATGRLFEVTPDKEIVWEYKSPHDERGATHGIYRAVRYAPEFVEPLLK